MGNAIHIQAEEIRTLLRERRIALGLSIRQAARAAGVPPTTMARVLRGESVPDLDNLALLLDWIGTPLAHLNEGHDGATNATAELTTPESVARILLADKKLRPGDAEIVMATFHAVYDGLLKRNGEDNTSDSNTSGSRVNAG